MFTKNEKRVEACCQCGININLTTICRKCRNGLSADTDKIYKEINDKGRGYQYCAKCKIDLFDSDYVRIKSLESNDYPFSPLLCIPCFKDFDAYKQFLKESK
jgi:hypothetical protein